MAKRVDVILKDSEYREIQRAARARKMSVAAWVREALEAEVQRERAADVERKLAVIRAAVQHECDPATDIDQMLREIESGYLNDPSMTKAKQ